MSIQANTTSIVKLNDYPRDKYNVLIPVTSMQVMSDMQRIIINEVRLDADEKGYDIYKERSSGKYAITKVGGMKLAAAANISIVSSESVKPDVCIKCIDMSKATGNAQPCGNCLHCHDVKFIVTIRVPEPSGGFRLISKPKEIDCTLEKATMTEQQFKRFLPHRAQICESKALMRCIRDALGLSAGYTLDELKKPFIIAHIVPNLDAPEIRQALANNCLKSMGMLFETPSDKALPVSENPPELPAPPADDFADEFVDDDDPFPDFSDGIYCDECGQEIVDTKGKNGKLWTADDIKAYSEGTFGKCLCPSCQHIAREGGA